MKMPPASRCVGIRRQPDHQIVHQIRNDHICLIRNAMHIRFRSPSERGKAVQFDVLPGRFHSQRIDLRSQHVSASEQRRRDRKDPRSAAHVDAAGASARQPLLHARYFSSACKARCLVCAGSERRSRIDLQHQLSCLCIISLPRRLHHDAVRDLRRFEEFLPVVLPVLVVESRKPLFLW